jgi:hypothetical protein
MTIEESICIRGKKEPTTKRSTVHLCTLVALLGLVIYLISNTFIYIKRETSSWGYLRSMTFAKAAPGEIVLHIGPHKVASSYIQVNMCSNSSLLEAVGLEIPLPEGCTCKPKRFASLALSLQNRSTDASKFSCSNDPIADFSNSLLPNKSYFISSEVFDRLDDSGVRRLRGLLNGFEVKIVVLYRRKLDHLVSYYSQIHKHGPTERFQDFLWDSMILRSDRRASGIFYSDLLRMYSSYFGAENVYVLSYDGMLSRDIDPWVGLLKALYPHKIEVKASADSNKRINSYHEPLFLSSVVMYNKLVDTSERITVECASKLPNFQDFDQAIRKNCGSVYLFFSLWMDSEMKYFHDAKFKLFWFEESPPRKDATSPVHCFHTSSLQMSAEIFSNHVQAIQDQKRRLC